MDTYVVVPCGVVEKLESVMRALNSGRNWTYFLPHSEYIPALPICIPHLKDLTEHVRLIETGANHNSLRRAQPRAMPEETDSPMITFLRC